MSGLPENRISREKLGNPIALKTKRVQPKPNPSDIMIYKTANYSTVTLVTYLPLTVYTVSM